MKNKPSAPNSEAMKKKKKKGMKSKLSVQNSKTMKAKAPQDNPFESIWSRKKFNILGKKRKEEERRRVGLSRSLAIQKREKTLLKEYEKSAKSSVFLDKRIGEQNEGLEEFDKAILRSQRERQLKLKKTSKYNLSDGEEGDFDFGDGYFPEKDDFEDDGTLDDDEHDHQFASEKKITFGQAADDQESGFPEGEENVPKTKQQVYQEIMMKSKTFKAEKAKEKEENEQFIEQLDKDFASLGQSEALLSLTQPNKMKALKSFVNNSISSDKPKKDSADIVQKKVPFQQEKTDDYDKLVGEMSLDMRARPSNRTKAPEELAQEEKERLEQLEEERQKRMVATDYSSNDDDDNSVDDEKLAKKQTHVSGDDLGDSFSENVDSRSKKAVWIDDLLRNENLCEDEDASCSGESENDDEDDEDDDEDAEEDDDYEDDEDDKVQTLKDWEQSDDDNIDTNLEDEDEEDKSDDNDEAKEDSIKIKKLSESRGKQRIKIKTNSEDNSLKEPELPYTIEAPKTFEELNALLENRSLHQIMEAIRRIRTFNAISIAAENRKKMQVFYGVLLQYFAVSASKKPLNLKLLNMLVKPLIEISTEIPYFAAICARQRLLRIRTQFCEDVKDAGKRSCPSVKTLILLRLWTMIFPCSDFRHAVTTPAMLLMSEYLMRCPIICGRDIAVGSFLCSMVLAVCKQSQKFCPEAVTFIQTMLMAALNNKQGYEDSQLYHLMEIKALTPLLRVQGHVEEITPLDFLSIMDLPDDSPYFSSDNYRASILFATIGTLKGFVNIYQGLKSFPEIFLPISKFLLKLAEEENLPDSLKVEIKDVAAHIESKSQEHHLLRQPLRMQKQKIIKTEIPKFEENFVKGRDYDPDRERAERKKMRKQVKQEAKGAIRELRKDNYFLLEVKERDKARLKEEKAEKYGRALAFLQEQEHAFKSGQLGKGKGKKRRR